MRYNCVFWGENISQLVAYEILSRIVNDLEIYQFTFYPGHIEMITSHAFNILEIIHTYCIDGDIAPLGDYTFVDGTMEDLTKEYCDDLYD